MRGDKHLYTAKQKRQADHIAQQYQVTGISKTEAQHRAWATVNQQSGGGERQGGSGRARSEADQQPARHESAQRTVRRASEADTKTELLQRARTEQLPGRSSMTKQQLIHALNRN